MREHNGFVHDTGFYSSDVDFRALLLRHLEPALVAGEPVILAHDERRTAQIRGWLPHRPEITFLTDRDLYTTPARAIATYQRLFADRMAAGATRICIAGEVPHEGNGGSFAGWDRYEAAVNTLWADFPVHGLCLYDAATTAGLVRDVVARTHPCRRAVDGGRVPSRSYVDPVAYRPLTPAPDRLTESAPVVRLVDPTPAQARTAVSSVVGGHVGTAVAADLVIGVSETVTNAGRHGRPPTVLAVWTGHDKVVVHVRDSGAGPADRLTGLTRTDTAAGLWLVHQTGLDVALVRDRNGFTVRLRADR